MFKVQCSKYRLENVFPCTFNLVLLLRSNFCVLIFVSYNYTALPKEYCHNLMQLYKKNRRLCSTEFPFFPHQSHLGALSLCRTNYFPNWSKGFINTDSCISTVRHYKEVGLLKETPSESSGGFQSQRDTIPIVVTPYCADCPYISINLQSPCSSADLLPEPGVSCTDEGCRALSQNFCPAPEELFWDLALNTRDVS